MPFSGARGGSDLGASYGANEPAARSSCSNRSKYSPAERTEGKSNHCRRLGAKRCPPQRNRSPSCSFADRAVKGPSSGDRDVRGGCHGHIHRHTLGIELGPLGYSEQTPTSKLPKTKRFSSHVLLARIAKPKRKANDLLAAI